MSRKSVSKNKKLINDHFDRLDERLNEHRWNVHSKIDSAFTDSVLARQKSSSSRGIPIFSLNSMHSARVDVLKKFDDKIDKDLTRSSNNRFLSISSLKKGSTYADVFEKLNNVREEAERNRFKKSFENKAVQVNQACIYGYCYENNNCCGPTKETLTLKRSRGNLKISRDEF